MSRNQTVLSGSPARVEERQAFSAPSTPKLSVNIAFTSERATAAALRYAATMTGGLEARLQVIIPQVVPYGRDLNDPPVKPEVTANRALEAARAAGVNADVNVVLCRDRAEGLHNALGADGIVVIGGAGRWWPFAERRLVRTLADKGHKVLFVDGEEKL